MHILKINTIGTFCNEYPKCLITLNNQTFYDGYINDNVFQIPLSEEFNSIVITHYDKHFGKNRRWDTKTQNNQITADRKIVIVDMLIDDISFKTAFNKFNFIQAPQDKEPIVESQTWDGNFNFNGHVKFEITPTPLSWITNLLYKKPIENISYFSNHSKLFHYEEELALIEELEGLLKNV